MKRAPLWFTHGKTRTRVQKYWPYGIGLLMGGLYYLAPEPFEEVRVSTLAAMRRPVLKGTEWLETRDVDPETMALELPPDQIFGPLSTAQQITFLLQALRDDNELADGYISRFVIDHMDFSLDPSPFTEALCGAGGGGGGEGVAGKGIRELIDFAFADFEEQRADAKHKFFGADQFLRFLNVVCNVPELAEYMLAKHAAVPIVFRALAEAHDEYARVYAMRVATLLAILQPRDGYVEAQLIKHRLLPRLVDSYRQSTGDPTDTRYQTLLLSSCLRLYPELAYPVMASEGIVGAAIANLNVTRYKGIPQHLRIIQDLVDVRPRSVAAGTLPPASEKGHRKLSHEPVSTTAQDPPPPAAAATKRGKAEPTMLDAAFANTPTPAAAAPKGAIDRPMSMEDPAAPVEDMLIQADFIPVALGVLEVFGEYREATEKLIELLVRVRPRIAAVDLLEYRALEVSCRALAKLDHRDEWRSSTARRSLLLFAHGVMSDPVCAEAIQQRKVSSDTLTAVITIQAEMKKYDEAPLKGAAPAEVNAAAKSSPTASPAILATNP